MREGTRTVDGVSIPAFLYGTAWKEDETERLATLAIEAGFRGIDTANQRKHYHEAAVGKDLTAAIGSGLATRPMIALRDEGKIARNHAHVSTS